MEGGAIRGPPLPHRPPTPALLPLYPAAPRGGWKGIYFPLAWVHAEPGCQVGWGGEAKPKSVEEGL